MGNGLRLLSCGATDNFLLCFLFFRELQVGLRYTDHDRTVCFKRDGARKVKALLRLASVLRRPATDQDTPLNGRISKLRQLRGRVPFLSENQITCRRGTN